MLVCSPSSKHSLSKITKLPKSTIFRSIIKCPNWDISIYVSIQVIEGCNRIEKVPEYDGFFRQIVKRRQLYEQAVFILLGGNPFIDKLKAEASFHKLREDGHKRKNLCVKFDYNEEIYLYHRLKKLEKNTLMSRTTTPSIIQPGTIRSVNQNILKSRIPLEKVVPTVQKPRPIPKQVLVDFPVNDKGDTIKFAVDSLSL